MHEENKRGLPFYLIVLNFKLNCSYLCSKCQTQISRFALNCTHTKYVVNCLNMQQQTATTALNEIMNNYLLAY